MRLPILLILMTFFLAHCSIEQDYKNISTSADSPGGGAEFEEEEEEITAVPPAVISGSYLVCQALGKSQASQTLDISCHFELDGNILTDVPLKEGDLVVVNELGEDLTLGFVKNDDGTFTIQAVLSESSEISISLKSIDGVELETTLEEEDSDRLNHVISIEEIAATDDRDDEQQSTDDTQEKATEEGGAEEEQAEEEQAEVEQAEEEQASLDCNAIGTPGTWVLVPGDPDYETEEFCVMKYEAKCSLTDGSTCNTVAANELPVSEAIGSPWTRINQPSAIAECESLGEGFRLISNPEWMTISSNAAGLGANWSSNLLGDGNLNQGHSDRNPDMPCSANADDAFGYVENDCLGLDTGEFKQRRTHFLSNSEIIWDLAGNAREWIDYVNLDDKPAPRIDSHVDYPDVLGTDTMPITDLIPAGKPFWDNSWTSAQSIGKYYSSANGGGGILVRGGDWRGTLSAGLFHARMWSNEATNNSYRGFRCVYSAAD